MNFKNMLVTLVLTVLALFVYPVSGLSDSISTELPKGFLISDDLGITVTKTGGYFFKLNDLYPGDVITRKLHIKNTGSEAHTLKLMVTPVSNKGPADLLKNMEMKIYFSGNLIFDGNLVSQNKKETHIGSEIDLGVIEPNTDPELDITLTVSKDIPMEYFADDHSKAVVNWIFLAGKDLGTVGTDKPSPTVKPKGSLPRTGEIIATVLTFLGVVMMIVTAWFYYTNFYKNSRLD